MAIRDDLIKAFSAFARATIAGQVSSSHRRTSAGRCSSARLSGRCEIWPQRSRYSPTVRIGFATPNSRLIDSITAGRFHSANPKPRRPGISSAKIERARYSCDNDSVRPIK